MTRKLIRDNRINKSWVLLFLVYLLTSCATGVRLANVEELSGNKPVVFGRIKGINRGYIYIISDAGPEPISYKYFLTGDGSFFWQLPSGGYVITDFEYRIVRKGILARFVVPEAMSPIYIGTLIIHLKAGHYTIDVEDEYMYALPRLKERFPEVSGPVTKRLMELR